MKIILLLSILLFHTRLFSQSLLLYTKQDNSLCITNFEKNETITLDSVCTYKIKSYSITGDSLICTTEDDLKKYYIISGFTHLLIKKNGFITMTDGKNRLRYYYNNYELKELDGNIISCSGEKANWEIVNNKNSRRVECNSEDSNINRMLPIFGHPVLSNKKDFFIYNQERWTWFTSSYKTYEVDLNTGKQTKLFHGLDTQISPTDQYLLFMDLNKRYYVYDRKNKERRTIKATSAFWLYN